MTSLSKLYEREQNMAHRIRAVFGDVPVEIVLVMHQVIIVSYQGFLPIATLKPVLQHIAQEQKLVILRNRNGLTLSRAIKRIGKVIQGGIWDMEY